MAAMERLVVKSNGSPVNEERRWASRPAGEFGGVGGIVGGSVRPVDATSNSFVHDGHLIRIAVDS